MEEGRSVLINLLPRERIELPYLYLQNSALTTKQPRLYKIYRYASKGGRDK